jgi:hypothetical protein
MAQGTNTDMTGPRRDLWHLQEVAHAAMELPLDDQTPRLRAAIARLSQTYAAGTSAAENPH